MAVSPRSAELSKQLGDSWIFLAPGSFTMGDDTSPRLLEKPQHLVRISHEIWMGRCTVSNLEYRRFLEDGGYRTRAYWSDVGWQWLHLRGKAYDRWFETAKVEYPLGDAAWYKADDSPRFWNNSIFNGDQKPVVGISFFEAEAYCAWLTVKKGPGLVVSLPTEAQWEWAARGSENRYYPWGNQKPDETRANYNRPKGKPTEPGSYPCGKTPEGIEDMAGNIWEWCQDLWSVNVYSKRAAGAMDPLETSADPSERVLRGGAWYNRADKLRAASRDRALGWYRNCDIGFRCVLQRQSPEHG